MARRVIRKVCFDACVVIDALGVNESRRVPASEIVARAENGEIQIHVSALALIETTKIKGIPDEQQESTILEFFNEDYIEVETVARDVAKKAREIRASHNIDQFDSIHVATAITHTCEALITTDGIKVGRKPGEKKLLDFDKLIEGLRIITPDEYLREGLGLLQMVVPEYANAVEQNRESQKGGPKTA